MFTSRRLQAANDSKGFLRYHDPSNWPALRETLRVMGRADLIGNGKGQLVPDEEKDKRTPRRPTKAKPGQKTGASHSSNRPTFEKIAENERTQRKQNKTNASSTESRPAKTGGGANRSKSKRPAASRTR